MKRRHFTSSAFASLASAAALACLAPVAGGCGSLGDVDRREPLAVIQGQLTQAGTTSAAAPSNVRIAVVWMNVSDSSYRATQDVQATPVFPSSYRLELTDPPPREAMASEESSPSEAPDAPSTPGNPGTPTPTPDPDKIGTRNVGERPSTAFSVAYGAVVAYEDRNGNGKLDLVDASATSYVDRILGANADLALIYIEGTAPEDAKDKNGRLPTAGFNIYRGIGRNCEYDATNGSALETRSAVSPTSEGAGNACAQPEWLGMSAAYNLPLTADPKFSKIMCKNGGDDSDSASAENLPGSDAQAPAGPGPNGKYPSKTDPNLRCAADGKSYTYSECVTYSEGLCKGDVMNCRNSAWSMPGTTAPAGWPCTLP